MASLMRIKWTVAALAMAGAASMAIAVPDVVLCQVYDLGQKSSDGTVRGLALATTSWNIGDTDLQWYQNPDARHPYIAMNMFRLADDRFEQIGTGWVKHGFFALGDLQCNIPDLPNCVYEPGHGVGEWLGQGCTDTYDSGLNANGLGPRFEINPWSGNFVYNTSMFNVGGLPANTKRQLRVQDADMNPALNPDATYFHQAYYVHFQDRDHMNSAAWKTCVPVRNGSGNYSFTQSGSGTMPTWGWAIDAWAGASQTTIAQQIPVVEGVSPDGRSVLSYKVTDNGDGTWHYEYAMLNVDMDKQVDSFSIPVPAGVNVTNIGFHAPTHTEPKAYVGGPVIDNAAWNGVVSAGAIKWSTTTNPIRWGTLYNFRFDADTAPTNTQVTVSLFKQGQGGDISLSGDTQGPSAPAPSCVGDVNGDLVIDVEDLNAVLGAWNTSVGLGDPRDVAGNDGFVDVNDLNAILGAWNQAC